RQRVDHVRPLARLARPVTGQAFVRLASEYEPGGSRLTLEGVRAVVAVRLHPLGNGIDDAVECGLRGRDQLSHLVLLRDVWSPRTCTHRDQAGSNACRDLSVVGAASKRHSVEDAVMPECARMSLEPYR